MIEKNLKAILEKVCDGWKSFLRHTLKRILRKKKSQVRSWEKTCGLGPTKEITVGKDCLRDNAPVELND